MTVIRRSARIRLVFFEAIVSKGKAQHGCDGNVWYDMQQGNNNDERKAVAVHCYAHIRRRVAFSYPDQQPTISNANITPLAL